MKTMNSIELKNKRVLVREDLNVPLDEQGNITSDLRIQAALPTLKKALDAKAAVIVISHLGRPKEGQYEAIFSLAPVAKRLSELLHQEVLLIKNWEAGVKVNAGEIVLLENVRFNVGEESDNDDLAKKLAGLCDVFVMDAFATAHRAQASTHGVAKFAKIACAGPLLEAELNALNKVLAAPKHPFIAIVGGSKTSSKLTVLENLINKVDQLIVGGGIANTFIAAAGYEVGKSLHEPDLIETAKMLIAKAKKMGATIPIPSDVVVAKIFSKDAPAEIKKVSDIANDDIILDIGPETAQHYADLLKGASTIVWNGPVGVFEFPTFEMGTKTLALAIAHSSAFTVAGGGDTIAAIDKYDLASKISYISTGGGAFLELLEGKKLPGVSVLK